MVRLNLTVVWSTECTPIHGFLLYAVSDKHQLRSDAKRLFLKQTPNKKARYGDEWTTELPDKFKDPNKKHRAARVSPREALTFGVLSVPAHYAAISNVLHETRNRLGEPWATNVEGFIDFGSGTGAGIWCALLVLLRLRLLF